jgi:AAHS family 4-hydroxybenzoate transporter-like MFS transporter
MGAVAGAMTGGLMMSMGLQFGAVFTLLAAPAFVAAFALGALSTRDDVSRGRVAEGVSSAE